MLLLSRPCVLVTLGRNLCLKRIPQNPPSSTAEAAGQGPMALKYRPTNFQKFMIVWTKKFKSKEDIPEFVSPSLIDRARNEVRIKIAIYMMLFSVIASIGAILSGKAAAKRGESIVKINQEFHRKYREKYNRKQEAAAGAADVK